MNLDLDKLEAAALAAGGKEWRDTGLSIRVASDEPFDTLVWWYDFEGDTKPEHRDHVVAANPAVVLELVRRLRAAESRPSATLVHLEGEFTEEDLEAFRKEWNARARAAQGGSHG